MSCLNESLPSIGSDSVEDGWGLEWGGIAAARQRFVWHERTRGSSIISRGIHPVATASRLRWPPAPGIRSTPHGFPAGRGAPRLAAQLPPPATASSNESDDVVANWRQELPGGDLHGSSKGILVNCLLPNRVPPLNVLPERGVMQRSERLFVGVPQMQAVLSSGSNTKGATQIMRWCPRDRRRMVADNAGPLGSRRPGIPNMRTCPRRGI